MTMPVKTKHATHTTTYDPATALVKRVWSFCDILRDEGVGASDYLEQITYLLFLKMAAEQKRKMPKEWNWEILVTKSGSELKDYYEKLLAALGREPGMLGQMFLQAKNQINTPARLAELVDMIGRQTWSGLDADLKGDIYEELLAKTAADKKSGAGQYFTPRALISTIMKCVRPQPGETFCDPACGTGGFFLKAHEYIREQFIEMLDRDQRMFLRDKTFYGNEIVATTRRLCLMNMYLHGLGRLDGDVPVALKDALVAPSPQLFKIVATNPPFGKKTAQTVINEAGEAAKEKVCYSRPDFWCTTSNKQLNFLQHIRTLLRTDGRAAVVLPDNVLFEKGAGETIRRKLLATADLHTILRLPNGIFYAQGVRANVLFFDARPAAKDIQTKAVWVYDYRTNIHHTLKANPLREEDLAEFVACYHPENRHVRKETWSEANPEGRWRRFPYEALAAREGFNLDLKWIKDKGDSVEDLSMDELVRDLQTQRAAYTAAVDDLTALLADEPANHMSLISKVSVVKDMRFTASRIDRKLLDLAIRGALVPQDSCDEPASALLERICAEKKKAAGKKGKKHTPPVPIPDDEIPFEIPEGWAWTRLGEVSTYGECVNVLAQDLPCTTWALDLEEIEKGTGRLLVRRTVGEKNVVGTRHAFSRGMILYSRLRTYLNKVLIADEDGVCSSEMIPFDVYGGISPEYIRHVLMSDYALHYTAEKGYGVKMPRLGTDDARKLPIPLPPLAEQRRIVKKVNAVRAALAPLRGDV